MNVSGGTGSREYTLEKVRVVVYRRTVSSDGQVDESVENGGNGGREKNEESGENKIEKIQIGKIDIGGISDSGSIQDGGAGEEETAKRLRERFCNVLGMDEETMEVSVYGTNEKTDR